MRAIITIDGIEDAYNLEFVVAAHRHAIAEMYDETPRSIQADESKAFNNGMLVSTSGSGFNARTIPLTPAQALLFFKELQQDIVPRTPKPLIGEADPELERLLAEEEEIERRTHARFTQDDDPGFDLPAMWQIRTGCTVIDADGWTTGARGDYAERKAWTIPISYQEFIERARVSTCRNFPRDA